MSSVEITGKASLRDIATMMLEAETFQNEAAAPDFNKLEKLFSEAIHSLLHPSKEISDYTVVALKSINASVVTIFNNIQKKVEPLPNEPTENLNNRKRDYNIELICYANIDKRIQTKI